MARAEGGINQRLKPGPAIVLSRARNPGAANTPVLIAAIPLKKRPQKIKVRHSLRDVLRCS
jgi:hypothetical protein